MNRLTRTALSAAVGGALAVPLPGRRPAAQAADEPYEVLVVGKTLGFRHSSIDEATTAIIALGQANGFTVDVWDPLHPDRAARRRRLGRPADAHAGEHAVHHAPRTSSSTPPSIFVSPVDGTNNLDPARPRLLDDSELAAYQGYIRDGGGYAGVHAATDTMHAVPWYSQLSGGGARFRNHPQQADRRQQVVEDRTHPSTAAPRRHLDPVRRVVQLHRLAPARGARAHQPRRDHVQPRLRRHGRRPPAVVVPQLRDGPLLVHRRRPHRGLLRRPGLPRAPARRDRVDRGRRSTAAATA